MSNDMAASMKFGALFVGVLVIRRTLSALEHWMGFCLLTYRRWLGLLSSCRSDGPVWRSTRKAKSAQTILNTTDMTLCFPRVRLRGFPAELAGLVFLSADGGRLLVH